MPYKGRRGFPGIVERYEKAEPDYGFLFRKAEFGCEKALNCFVESGFPQLPRHNSDIEGMEEQGMINFSVFFGFLFCPKKFKLLHPVRL